MRNEKIRFCLTNLTFLIQNKRGVLLGTCVVGYHQPFARNLLQYQQKIPLQIAGRGPRQVPVPYHLRRIGRKQRHA